MLDAVDAHLSDQRLHIVAAPGAGKTVLGLETIRRLGKPALVLAPTRTVRDQWIHRIQDFTDEPATWASTSLDDIQLLTVVTYQALHARVTESAEDLARTLRNRGIRTLVLDEAHHLHTAWWKAMTDVTEALDDLVLVALTATPPIDAGRREWSRYATLCGPVDEEIAIPELVRSGTLCPHQDFVWVTTPTESEREVLARQDARAAAIVAKFAGDPEFLQLVAGHPWITDEHLEPEEILDRPECAVAFLVVLRAKSKALPPHVLDLLSLQPDELPPLSRRWWNVLLQSYFANEPRWPEAAERHRAVSTQWLREAGYGQPQHLRLDIARDDLARLSRSTAKLQACVDVHRIEREIRGDTLRQVILTDFIHENEPEKLGAWPVFRRLCETHQPEAPDLALITGRLALLPGHLQHRLSDLLSVDEIPVSPSRVPGFVSLDTAVVPGLVRGVTHLLSDGALRTLVGTRALLGQGWDAPAVNSIVLASHTASYVSTNQMRGRALRRFAPNPDKVSSIWHLVTLDPAIPQGQADLERLDRRFAAFAGLAEDRPRIESGLDRLALPAFKSETDLLLWNTSNTDRLRRLDLIRKRWAEAVHDEEARVWPTVDLREPERGRARRRRIVFGNTLGALGGILVSVGAAVALEAAELYLRLGRLAWLRWGILAIAAVGLWPAVPAFVRGVRILTRRLPIAGDLPRIGRAVQEALTEAGLIRTSPNDLRVVVEETSAGIWSSTLRGATFHEQSLYADALADVLAPIDNPRYLITRPGRALWKRRTDYHAVPTVLAIHRSLASTFQQAWRKHVGHGELSYTRSRDGRRRLLAARGRALSSEFTDAVTRRDRWS